MLLKKIISLFIAISFLASSIYPGYARAEGLNLPAPNQFVNLSANYSFPVLKGLRFDPQSPLEMEFIIDTASQRKVTEEEAARLIRYFLAGLTVPDDELWVNMSPYEADKMVPKALSETDLGKDLLSQDYILKQLSSSLTYPESDTGKDFWQKTYQEVLKVANTTKLPVNTFNKIWIMPDKAEVYQNEDTLLVTKATLKTLLEEDYLALKNNLGSIQKQKRNMQEDLINKVNEASSKVMRDEILPRINAEVNSGKNFATLRQIHYSLVLAAWFKEKFRESIYKHYIAKNKVAGIDLDDKGAKDKIYNLYVEAFRKGVYNYIKPEKDLSTGRQIKRQYFSGGVVEAGSAIRAASVVNPLGNSFPADLISGTGVGMRVRMIPGEGENEASSPVTAKARVYGQPLTIKVSKEVDSTKPGMTLAEITFIQDEMAENFQTWINRPIAEDSLDTARIIADYLGPRIDLIKHPEAYYDLPMNVRALSVISAASPMAEAVATMNQKLNWFDGRGTNHIVKVAFPKTEKERELFQEGYFIKTGEETIPGDPNDRVEHRFLVWPGAEAGEAWDFVKENVSGIPEEIKAVLDVEFSAAGSPKQGDVSISPQAPAAGEEGKEGAASPVTIEQILNLSLQDLIEVLDMTIYNVSRQVGDYSVEVSQIVFPGIEKSKAKDREEALSFLRDKLYSFREAVEDGLHYWTADFKKENNQPYGQFRYILWTENFSYIKKAAEELLRGERINLSALAAGEGKEGANSPMEKENIANCILNEKYEEAIDLLAGISKEQQVDIFDKASDLIVYEQMPRVRDLKPKESLWRIYTFFQYVLSKDDARIDKEIYRLAEKGIEFLQITHGFSEGKGDVSISPQAPAAGEGAALPLSKEDKDIIIKRYHNDLRSIEKHAEVFYEDIEPILRKISPDTQLDRLDRPIWEILVRSFQRLTRGPSDKPEVLAAVKDTFIITLRLYDDFRGEISVPLEDLLRQTKNIKHGQARDEIKKALQSYVDKKAPVGSPADTAGSAKAVSSLFDKKGGIDLGGVKVGASGAASPISLRFDELARTIAASSGITFRIIEMKPLPVNPARIFGVFQKVEEGSEPEQLAYLKE